MSPPEPSPDPAVDELAHYLRRDSALSRRYQRESAAVPPAMLDRRVLARARASRLSSARLAPLAFAASLLLSLAMVLAVVFGPQPVRRGAEPPRVVKAALRAERPAAPARSGRDAPKPAAVWLREIAALQRAGRAREAEAQYRLFVQAYPAWAVNGAAAPRRDPGLGEFR